MAPFFSIIIPVYNAEKTLTRCIRSILSQTDDDYEAIFVDDGSTDQSLSVCRKFEKENSKFTVIHQENAGVSAARNKGMARASGEYLFFVDADDYLESVTIAKLKDACCLSNSATGYDMCFFGYVIEDEKRKRVEKVLPDYYKGLKDPEILLGLMQKNLFGLAFNKVIRRELIKSNEICFTVGRKVFEDQEFLIKVWNASNNNMCIDEVLYHYTQNDNSAMRKTIRDSLEFFLASKNENLVKLEQFMRENEIAEKDIRNYLMLCASSDIRMTVKMICTLPGYRLHSGLEIVRNGKMHEIIMSGNDQMDLKVKLYRFLLGNKHAEFNICVLKFLLSKIL